MSLSLLRLTWLPVLLGASVFAAPPSSRVESVRALGPIRVDGRLEDSDWARAPVFSRFVESYPQEGAEPSERTEVRVLFDDDNVYFGITCFDTHPEQIKRQLGRRDTQPTADLIEVAIDPTHDLRTAYLFSINAAGVQRDALLFGDVNATDTWDEVWDAAVAEHPDGWTAEIAVPLRVLRFPAAAEQKWCVLVRRTLPRSHQVFDSALIPRSANPGRAGEAVVSRFGELGGLVNLKPRPDIELSPYLAARTRLRPQFSDPSTPLPRLLSPSADLGLDLKASLSSELTLNATVNPDFGQVEADRVIQNFNTAESFFPEKRPFFSQGLDLFEPVGSEYDVPYRPFYSRRIGLRTPIFGAAKLTGTLRPGLEVGVLDAVVSGPGNPSLGARAGQSLGEGALLASEEQPDRNFQFHSSRPFHFGLNDELPARRPLTTNFLAAVARQQLGGSSSVGALVTSALPLEPACRRADFDSDEAYAAADCLALGGDAAGLDWNLRSADGVYGVFGQLNGSEQVGGPKLGRTLADGTVLYPGSLGYAATARGGKLGGEPFRFDLAYIYLSPTLDLNSVGFLPGQNIQWADANLHYVRPNGFGALRSFSLDYNFDINWSADGRGTPRGLFSRIEAHATLPSYDSISVVLGWEDAQYELREIPRSGIPFERRSDRFFALGAGTDSNRALFAGGDVYLITLPPAGTVPHQFGWGLDLSLTWRPQARLETNLLAAYGNKPYGQRFIEQQAGDRYVFGGLDAETLSLTLRQQLVIVPRLTLQAYAQLFTEADRFHSFASVVAPNATRIDQASLSPYDAVADPSGHTSALNLNLVLRWEYRLGSTFFAVYSRSQQELPAPMGQAPAPGFLPARLGQGPLTDTFLLKWSYWWEV